MSSVNADRPRVPWRWAILAGVLLLACFLAWKGARLLQLTLALRADVAGLQAVASQAPSLPALQEAGPVIAQTRQDAAALRAEASPFLWLTPALAWAPVYGPDLAAAGPLLDLASGLTQAADEAYAGLAPLLAASRLTPQQALAMLAAAAPRLQAAQAAAGQALAARAQITPDALSPKTRRLVDRADAVLPLLQPGLALALAAPNLLGASAPHTYLLLIQNQDELRPTGGFISAAGTLTVEGGQVKALNIDDSAAADDFSLRYALPPPPLKRYMGADIWLLRDANWSPDFPTSAALAEALYTAARPQPVDGVIAVNQSALRLLLKATGPLTLPDAPEPITAANVEDYMRAAWSPAPGQAATGAWWQHRKDFIPRLAAAILDRLPDLDFSAVALAARQALAERQVLIWLKDPRASAALATLGWDGALQPGNGDYLMVVDANVGFNKVNAVVRTQITYTVDLSTPQTPTAMVEVEHFNPATGALPCRQKVDYSQDAITSYADLVQRCYFDYLRVYRPAGAELQGASLQAVPGEWLLSGQAVSGTVDADVEAGGVQSFGTFTVTPFGRRQATSLTFGLPAQVVRAASGQWAYRLHVQKQPGALAASLVIRVQLPGGAAVTSASPAPERAGAFWQWTMSLTQDVDVDLIWKRGNP